ncbi:MAG: hypothetical protein HRU15_10495 [Planctomycetes bacterium]|nr:hypothetical protein [Planctomycetota bacterium]
MSKSKAIVIRIRKKSDRLQLEGGIPYIIEMPRLQHTLHRQATQSKDVPAFSIQLPEGFNRKISYPVYLNIGAGNGGTGRRDSFQSEEKIVGRKKYILLHFPLFQSQFDSTSTPADGVMLTQHDHTALSENFGKMFALVQASFPKLDYERSCMGGFSNGAHATGVLLTMRDQKILPYFKNIILLEGGAFQMNDVYSPAYQGKNIVMMQGQFCYGSKGTNRQRCDEVYDIAQHYDIHLSRVLMWDVGHSMSIDQPRLLKKWLSAIRAKRGKKIQEEFEAEWQFSVGVEVKAKVKGGKKECSLRIHNPFEEKLQLSVVTEGLSDSQTEIWKSIPAKKSFTIAAGKNKELSFVLEGKDFNNFPDIQLLGDRQRSLSALFREAIEAGSL